jgi:malate permease and related proteins
MKLLQLYLPLVILVLSGFVLGGKLPATIPLYLGQFLFWVGVPLRTRASLEDVFLVTTEEKLPPQASEDEPITPQEEI